jgi:hypothetical protein
MACVAWLIIYSLGIHAFLYLTQFYYPLMSLCLGSSYSYHGINNGHDASVSCQGQLHFFLYPDLYTYVCIEVHRSRRRSNDASPNRENIYIAVSLLVVFPHLSIVTRC